MIRSIQRQQRNVSSLRGLLGRSSTIRPVVGYSPTKNSSDLCWVPENLPPRTSIREMSTTTVKIQNADTRTNSNTTNNKTLNNEQNHHIHNHNKDDRLLVIGSGVAGSAAALIAAETYKIPVTLLFAGSIPIDCNSNWAQGGIIYRNYDPESGDSSDSLANDIHRAGAGLCDDDAVRKVAEEGPERVRQLLLCSGGSPFADVPFDKKPNGELSLCLGKFFVGVFFGSPPSMLLSFLLGQ